MPIEPTNEPLDADSKEDTVLIEGGAGCVMSMTPQLRWTARIGLTERRRKQLARG